MNEKPHHTSVGTGLVGRPRDKYGFDGVICEPSSCTSSHHSLHGNDRSRHTTQNGRGKRIHGAGSALLPLLALPQCTRGNLTRLNTYVDIDGVARHATAPLFLGRGRWGIGHEYPTLLCVCRLGRSTTMTSRNEHPKFQEIAIGDP